MRTAGNMGGYTDLNVARRIAAREIPGPDIYVTAPYFNGPGLPIHGVKALKDSSDAVRMATSWAEEGATSSEAHMQLPREFVRLGGRLYLGTDPTGYGGVVPGYANQRAMQLLIEAGVSPLETIRRATRNGAELLSLADHTGTLAVGKDADLVLLDGNPLTDSAALTRMELVFKRGTGDDNKMLFASVKGLVGWRWARSACGPVRPRRIAPLRLRRNRAHFPTAPDTRRAPVSPPCCRSRAEGVTHARRSRRPEDLCQPLREGILERPRLQQSRPVRHQGLCPHPARHA